MEKNKKMKEKLKNFILQRRNQYLILSFVVALLILGSIFAYLNLYEKEDKVVLDKDVVNELLPLPGCDVYKNDEQARLDGVTHGDIVACMCVSDESIKSQCESEAKDQAYLNSATSGCNPGLCEKITDEEMKVRCLEHLESKDLNMLPEERGDCILKGGDVDSSLVSMQDAAMIYQNIDSLIKFAETIAYKSIEDEENRDEYISYAYGLVDEAENIGPESPAVFSARGYIAKTEGDYERSIEEYTAAIDINEFFIKAYVGRAETYYLDDQYDKAIEDLESGIEIDIDGIYSPLDTKLCEIVEGSNDEDLFRRSIEGCMIVAFDPDMNIQDRIDSFNKLGSLYELSDRDNEADSYYQMAKNLE